MNGRQPRERQACGAKTRSGEPCKKPPTPGRTRCRLHGGASPAGIAHYAYKTGRWSKHFPERLRERYEEAQSDPELRALREDIALVDARIVDLLKRVDSGESGELWKKVQASWRAHTKANASDDPVARMAAYDDLDSLIQHGLMDHAAWSDISRLLDQRRKLAESERKRLVDMQQMLTAEQAMLFVAALSDAVRACVSDRETLAAIAREFETICAHPGVGFTDLYTCESREKESPACDSVTAW